MHRIAIGAQSFEKLIERKCLYIDKTDFIREWWKEEDDVTLIARPRRFGKTLNLSMLDCFFSTKYADRGDELFGELSVWRDKELQKEQGRWPVIFLSFAGVKETTCADAVRTCCRTISQAFSAHRELLVSDKLLASDKDYCLAAIAEVKREDAADALHRLSGILEQHYGKKVLIFLDEYDTPMQEAYAGGYWEEMATFMRALFNNTFKTNPSLGRAMMTGITRVSRESMFSDLNNLTVVTTTSNKYETAFGFTEKEVLSAMDECGLKNYEEVKAWYDGFTFGNISDIYNPWSITNFLDSGKLDAYWANTSSNALVGKLVREGDNALKYEFEDLLRGGTLEAKIDEQIVFDEIGNKNDSVWSLLLAGGYLKILSMKGEFYRLALTNREVQIAFEKVVSRWFDPVNSVYNAFAKALSKGDIRAMNDYMNDVSEGIFSSFDTGNKPSRSAPERFYHGFVLGLIVDLKDRYEITSNRESGYGRYDVMMVPKLEDLPAILIEFKVYDAGQERDLGETVRAALLQIEEKKYERVLLDRGIVPNRIRKYGFAFQGKRVLIGEVANE